MADKMLRLRQEAARWFMRMQHAAPDHPERGRFEAWLMAHPAHAREYAAIAETWEDFDSTSRLNALARALERKRAELRGKRARLGKAVSRGVLGVLLVVSSGLLGHSMWREWQAQPVFELARSTGIGEVGQQGLEDGTLLTLNAGTSVDVVYYRDKRMVHLRRGEAVFHVAKDVARPFIVESGHARVTVLGTRFAVNRLDGMVRVSVDHGRVRVEATDASGKVRTAPLVLNDGQVAEVNAGELPRHSRRSASNAFAFQGGSVVFEEASLHEVAETLSRYRKKSVKATAEQEGPRITAVVQTRDIDRFLKLLSRIAPVSVLDTPGETRLVPRN